MCGPRTHPISKKYSQTLEKDKVINQEEFEHCGIVVGRSRNSFAIDDTRIKILGIGLKYWASNGDPDAEYLAFKFVNGAGTIGKKYIITHKAFVRTARLWEEKLPPRYVTIGQLMEKNGEAPCEEGCRAILAFLKSSRDAARGVRRDKAIIEITKECMRHGSWSLVRSTQDLYDFYVKEYSEPMPYEFLVWMTQSMGGTVLGSSDWNYGPGSKSYTLICRQLGIKP